MHITVDGDISFEDSQTGRKCGDCTLCCKLVPVEEIMKPAGEKCRHVRHGKGCSIYNHRPFSCMMWSCRWLIDPDTAAMRRPNRSHYVIDIGEDSVRLSNDLTGEEFEVPVIQIWCDPAYPDAHKDPHLRDYIAAKSMHGIAAIIRYNSKDGFTIFGPGFSKDGIWREHNAECVTEEAHQAALARIRSK
jgi:hypothetical protein